MAGFNGGGAGWATAVDSGAIPGVDGPGSGIAAAAEGAGAPAVVVRGGLASGGDNQAIGW